MITQERGLIVCALAVALLASAQALATNVPQMTFNELINKTALAFTGTVIESDPTHFDQERNEPVTKVTFLIDEVQKGVWTDQEIEFFVPGGQYPNGEILEYENSPVFQENETYLVFVRDGPWTITPVTNWWHSAFRETELAGKRVLVNQFGQAVTKVDDRGFVVGPRVGLPEQSLIRRYHAQRFPDRIQPSDAGLLERPTEKLREEARNAPAMLVQPETFTANTTCSDCAEADKILGVLGDMINERALSASNALAANGQKSSVQGGQGRVMHQARPRLVLHRDDSKASANPRALAPTRQATPQPMNPSVDENFDLDTFPLED